MKLSEAMMLPSEITFDPMEFNSCLLGQALNVVTGEENAFDGDICGEWPWLYRMFTVPEEFGVPGQRRTGVDIVTIFAFRVERGQVTREQVADWVRSVEPAEVNEPDSQPAAPITQSELCRKT